MLDFDILEILSLVAFQTESFGVSDGRRSVQVV